MPRYRIDWPNACFFTVIYGLVMLAREIFR